MEPNSYLFSVVKVLYKKSLDIWYSRIIHLISFKLTVSIADTNRCLDVNFLDNRTNFKVNKDILNRLNKGRVVFYRDIGTQGLWNFSKILILSGQMRDP